MQKFIVGENDAGQRLDKLLGKYLNKAPKSFFYKMLRKKNITLNGKKAEGSERLELGDQICFYLSDETMEGFKETSTVHPQGSVDIIYEDKHILLLNKPVGLLSQKANREDTSLNEAMLWYLLHSKQIKEEELAHFRPGICNRLDRNTSGIVIAGKSLLGLQKMSELIKNRTLDKYYECIVFGKMTNSEHITGYLLKDEDLNRVKVYTAEEIKALSINKNNDIEAKDWKLNWIETSYQPLKYSEEYTLLKVKLITGKSHQIRAHLASIGHPIIGDSKYGRTKENQMLKNKFGLSNQLLHAAHIHFPELSDEFFNISNQEFFANPPALFLRIKNQLFQ